MNRYRLKDVYMRWRLQFIASGSVLKLKLFYFMLSGLRHGGRHFEFTWPAGCFGYFAQQIDWIFGMAPVTILVTEQQAYIFKVHINQTCDKNLYVEYKNTICICVIPAKLWVLFITLLCCALMQGIQETVMPVGFNTRSKECWKQTTCGWRPNWKGGGRQEGLINCQVNMKKIIFLRFDIQIKHLVAKKHAWNNTLYMYMYILYFLNVILSCFIPNHWLWGISEVQQGMSFFVDSGAP